MLVNRLAPQKLVHNVPFWLVHIDCLFGAYAHERKGGGVRFKNTIFVVSRSDTYIVSIQQILCSAISRGFEPCSAARKHNVQILPKCGGVHKLPQKEVLPRNVKA